MIKQEIKIARSLRKNITPWELKAWAILRNRQIDGLKFRRKRLILELDGGQHDLTKNRREDAVRQNYLESQGYTVVRLWNNEVANNLEGVVEKVLLTLALSSERRGNEAEK